VAQAVTGVTLDGSDDVDDDACRAGVDHLAGGKGKSASRTAPRQPAKGANGPKAKTGKRVRHGGITKAGIPRARRVVIEEP
jgi:hypothetical protein